MTKQKKITEKGEEEAIITARREMVHKLALELDKGIGKVEEELGDVTILEIAIALQVVYGAIIEDLYKGKNEINDKTEEDC